MVLPRAIDLLLSVLLLLRGDGGNVLGGEGKRARVRPKSCGLMGKKEDYYMCKRVEEEVRC